MKYMHALACALLLLSTIPLCAETRTHSVGGTISVGREGTVRLMLYTEETFGRDEGRGAPYTVTLAARGSGSGSVRIPFTVEEVAEGMYCIICFLDTNGNGVLDKGLFGPTEPMSTYRKRAAAIGKPRFTDIAFPVDRDVDDILVELK
jgi:uncharacterized protein (DUF2141 family)